MVRSLTSDLTGWATVVAFDQGGTTGWCVMAVKPTHLLTAEGPLLHKRVQHWACGQITGSEDKQTDDMMELCEAWPDAAVILETFILRKFIQSQELLSPVRIKAKFEYAWHSSDFKGKFIFNQQPSMAMSMLTDERQKEWRACGRPLWTPGQDHARDATKHAYTFLHRARSNPRMRASAWPLLFGASGQLLKRAPQASKRKHY